MHDPAIKQEALALIAAGMNDCAVARELGVPRATVRNWRRPRYVRRRATEICWRCWSPSRPTRLPAADYTLLLGLYLGDGCISHLPRTSSLRITLDRRYPHILDETEALVRRCFPGNEVSRVVRRSDRGVDVQVASSHLVCVLPQHGPGKKHERAIVLEPWQIDAVICAPWMFLRGLLWSDGCSFVNRTGRYAYASWEFANLSRDILDLFVGTCEYLGVAVREYATSIRIYRREAVEAINQNVGIKR